MIFAHTINFNSVWCGKNVMDIVFHPRFFKGNYSPDPAAASGRIEPIMLALEGEGIYNFREPDPATEEQVLRAHTRRYVNEVMGEKRAFKMAMLAAGGAILSAQIAWSGMPSFAVIRPPGHHASADSAWGFCYFNNAAISLLDLFASTPATSAFILDFDHHFGDGTVNILGANPQVKILNPTQTSSEDTYLAEVAETLAGAGSFDIILGSAGFDEGLNDWGHLLSYAAYEEIGKLMKDYAEDQCKGRRYAILEGGYNHEELGKNAAAFCRGFRD